MAHYNARPAIERFWEKVNKSTLSGCWLWTAGKTDEGYGRLWVNRKLVYPHRFSYELHFGPIAPGLVVMHACDKPRCVRPEHLSLGTNHDNAQDCIRKGRQGSKKHRLTKEERIVIGLAYLSGTTTRKAVAQKYGVALRTVQKCAELALTSS